MVDLHLNAFMKHQKKKKKKIKMTTKENNCLKYFEYPQLNETVQIACNI